MNDATDQYVAKGGESRWGIEPVFNSTQVEPIGVGDRVAFWKSSPRNHERREVSGHKRRYPLSFTQTSPRKSLSRIARPNLTHHRLSQIDRELLRRSLCRLNYFVQELVSVRGWSKVRNRRCAIVNFMGDDVGPLKPRALPMEPVGLLPLLMSLFFLLTRLRAASAERILDRDVDMMHVGHRP